MNGRDCRQAGFTLIELLITITIIVLITGTAIAAYVTFNENRQLDIDTRAFLSTLNRVRARAIFLEYPADCTSLVSYNLETVLGSSDTLDSVHSYATCLEGVRGSETTKIFETAVFTTPKVISFFPSTGETASGQDELVTIMGTKGEQKSKTVTINRAMNNVNSVFDN